MGVPLRIFGVGGARDFRCVVVGGIVLGYCSVEGSIFLVA